MAKKANPQVSDQALTEPDNVPELFTKAHSITLENEKVISIKLGDYTITDDGQKLTVLDVLKACESADRKLESLHTQIERITGELSRYMVLLAAKAKDVNHLKAMFKVAEESLRWGRAPVGTTDKERKLYTGKLPDTYKQYKSKLIASMEKGVVPLHKYSVTQKLPRATKDGETERQVYKTADTIHQMLTIARDLDRKAQESKKEPTRSPVAQDGSQVLHTDLSQLLGQVSTLYSTCDVDGKIAAINTLENLIKHLTKHQPKDVDTKAA